MIASSIMSLLVVSSERFHSDRSRLTCITSENDSQLNRNLHIVSVWNVLLCDSDIC